MKNRHAYLIIAHNQFELLIMLLKCLDHPQHNFYIHIDEKVENFDSKLFDGAVRHSKIIFTPRVNVAWGGFSMIEAELTLLKAAINGEYDYYHLLSGVDLPLRSAQELCDFFAKNQGKEFIHYSSPEYCRSENTIRRLRYHHYLQERVGRSRGMGIFAERCLLKAQKLLGVNRLRGQSFEVKCGAQWFSITHDLANYVLTQEEWIRKVFRNSFCADEVFLQTIVWNSDFRKNLYLPNDNSDYRSCLRYVDWNRGNPYVFRLEDYHTLISSDFLFARKFDIEKDWEICEKIADHVLTQ